MIEGFDDNNGCIRVIVEDKDFKRVIISQFAVTFHWEDTPHRIAPAQDYLIDLVAERGLNSVDGRDDNHSRMHFDLEGDAAEPDLHMHIAGDVDDAAFKAQIHLVIERLTGRGFLRPNEFARLCRGIAAYNAWE